MENAKLKKLSQDAQDFAKKLGNLLVLAVALFAGTVIGYYYHHFTKTKSTIKVDEVKTIAETSVAINERKELLIIDRASGRYVIYDDSVGTAIFTMYANRLYLNQVSNK